MRIGIVAPGRAIDEAIAARVKQAASAAYGAQAALVFHPQCFAAYGHFAGDDALRTEAFVSFANDPDLDAIWFARGGYGACRIAEAAVARLGAAAAGKTYLGYSDAGFLLAALDRAGIGRLVHGPMPSDILRDGGDEAVGRALRFLIEGGEKGVEPAAAGEAAPVAFNMTILAHTMGTPLQPNLKGRTVHLEEVGEHHYRLDRMMFQIAPGLQGAAGVRLGRCADIPENDIAFAATEEDIVRFWCARAGVAYLGRSDIGHDSGNKIVPFGPIGR